MDYRFKRVFTDLLFGGLTENKFFELNKPKKRTMARFVAYFKDFFVELELRKICDKIFDFYVLLCPKKRKFRKTDKKKTQIEWKIV